jgi:hypothetical protein
LDEVGEADGHEAAEKGVGHHHPGGDPQAKRIIRAERALEQLAAGDHAA